MSNVTLRIISTNNGIPALAVPAGVDFCPFPGGHRARQFAGGAVVCPGCNRMCRLPESVTHDDEFITVRGNVK